MAGTISIAQAQQYAQQAGFRGNAISTIVAIARAESGLNPSAYNCAGNSAGCDRGILQINSYYHSEVSDQCSYNPLCAFQQAYRISNNGTNFSPWTTYTSGAYKPYIGSITSGAASPPPPAATPQSSSSPDFITGITEHVFVFLLALVLIVVGFIIIARPAVEGAAEKGAFL
jgi:hypothetical protein